MTTNIEELIDRINKAKYPSDLFTINNIDDEYKEIAKVIHPDLCKHPNAPTAAARLTELVQEHQNKEGVDEAGKYKLVKGLKILRPEFEKYKNFLIRSARNKTLLTGKMKADEYTIPKYGVKDGEFISEFNTRVTSFAGRTLPEEHVRWMLSRMLEFSAYCLDAGFIHAGINPDSALFKPDVHGLQISSFYHLTAVGINLQTIPGKYAHWYPPYLKKEKIARPNLDSILAKKTAMYLLGDPSGSGTKLKRTVDKHLADFLLMDHNDSIDAFVYYKENTLKQYKTEFHILNE